MENVLPSLDDNPAAASAAPPLRVRRFRVFVLVSAGLHLAVLAAWGIPEYVLFAEARRQSEERRQLLALRKELEVKAQLEEKKRAQDASAREVLQFLRWDFDRIIGEKLTRRDTAELWKDTVASLDAPLKQYALDLGDTDVSEAALASRLNDLKRNLVNCICDRLKDTLAEQLADEFLAAIETQLAPRLAERYRAEIGRRIASPLCQESARILREEKLDSGEQHCELCSILQYLEVDKMGEMLESAFQRSFAERSVPRLAEKLCQAFKQVLDAAGINDEKTVCTVKTEAQTMLLSSIPKLTRAAEASIAVLEKTERAGDAPAAPPPPLSGKSHAARMEALVRHIWQAAQTLAEKEMPALAAESLHDESVLGAVREPLAGGGRTVRSVRRQTAARAASALAAGTAAGAPAASEEATDSETLQEVLDRVAVLAANVNADRMGFLDASGPVFEGGASAKRTGALPASTRTPSAAGRSPKPRANPRVAGLSGVAWLRQAALERSLPWRKTVRPGPAFNSEEYARLTAGIGARDSNAARGDAWIRDQNGGAAAVRPAGFGGVKYASLLIPPDPKEAILGKALAKEPYRPPFRTIRFAAIPFLDRTFALDGTLDKWKSIPALPLSRADHREHPGLRVVDPQLVKVAWDNTGFYFAYNVKDADGKIRKAHPDNFWEGDGVEIWFDARNTKEKTCTSGLAQQFWVWPFGQEGDDAKAGGEVDVQANKLRLCTPGEIQRVAKLTTEGWTMEVHIPVERIRELSLQAGRILGFNLSICTGTDIYYYWAGTDEVNTSMRPDTWGDVLLAGSSGTLEVVDKLAGELKTGGSSQPQWHVAIGEPVRLRITDPDMNLSSQRREQLTVSVRARTGASMLAVLEETSESSGVFEGTVATTLNLGDPVVGALPLYEGETVDIVYLDQARADGSRNVEVRASIKAALGILEQHIGRTK